MTIKKSISRIVFVVLVVTSFSTLAVNQVITTSSQDVLSAWATVTPTIDGKISRDEWTDADSFSSTMECPPSTHKVTLYAKNDADNLYLAAIVEGDEFNSNDFGNWQFKADPDGPIAIGDDGLSIRSDGLSSDRFRSKNIEGWWSRDADDGGTNDLVGAVSHSNPSGIGNYVFEYQHPLDTSDNDHDFSLKPGDTIGYVFYLADGGPETCDTWWHPDGYGTLKIAQPQITLIPIISPIPITIPILTTTVTEVPEEALSAWAMIKPRIDGTLSTGEWEDADSLKGVIDCSEGQATKHSATLFVKNDGIYLYLAVIVKDDEYNSNDFGNWHFKDSEDASTKVGDDGLSVRSDGLASDLYRSNTVEGWWSRDELAGGTNDLVGAASHTNPTGVGDYTFEYRHPLDTADNTHDFSLKLGDAIGFVFEFADGGPERCNPWWHGGYGTIVIAAPTKPTPKTLTAWATVTPVIDGVLTPNEWEDADSMIGLIDCSEGKASTHPVTLFVKNDGTYLYLAVVVMNDEYNSNDFGNWWFKEDPDGPTKVGDDGLSVRSDGLSSDRYRSNTVEGWWSRDADDGGTNDLVGAASHTNPSGVGDYTFEYRHPLDTADNTHDFSLNFGDDIGFVFNFADGGPENCNAWWHPDGYGTIVIASPVLQPVFTPVLTAVLPPLLTLEPVPKEFIAWATISPTIDGAISPGEWDDAATGVSVIECLDAPDTPKHQIKIFVKNDGTNLYLAAVVTNDEFNDNDFGNWHFKEDPNSPIAVGDDGLSIRSDGLASDLYRSNTVEGWWSRDADDGGTNDLVGAASHTNPSGVGDYIFEYQHPLDTSDDVHDFSLNFGDDIGFQFSFADGGPGSCDQWPGLPDYGTIVIAAPEAPPEYLSAWATVTPTIDGKIARGEWDDAASVTSVIECSEGQATTHEIVIFVKNDGEYLYLAAIVKNDEYNSNDFGNWHFKEDPAGPIAVGDDGLSIRSDSLASDLYRSNTVEGWWSRDADDGGTNDLVGAASHTNPSGVGDYTFEYQHPLDTSDNAHDFSLKPGDDIGFQFSFADGGPERCEQWPGLPDYGAIVIASPGAPIKTTLETPVKTTEETKPPETTSGETEPASISTRETETTTPSEAPPEIPGFELLPALIGLPFLLWFRRRRHR